jgi:hypothetical protein
MVGEVAPPAPLDVMSPLPGLAPLPTGPPL